ncbi:tRNA (adenine(22)-N(1))-methyltransferase [Pectinatus sottacetonis]|uniref:tRNA (adenine(22)-N(1))-methyltransferase n=1 Tax=Pectinatus sottacetonis TaxID=1002795 RepID=UPI0018C63E64|nr:class I SAM-dependent methyltransferase [Pectinatus sottacetonis]
MPSIRLRTVAAFVPVNAVIADIGTDHACLPIYLIKKHVINHAIAIDINKGPYITAQKAVKAKNMTTKIDVRLGSGLSPIKTGEITTAVFAGMGGILISSLLKESTHIVSSLNDLILQPQLAADKLRHYLYQIGWHITDEALAKEQNHIYQIIYALPGKKQMPTPIELEVGPVLINKRPPLFNLHIKELLRRNNKILTGLKKASTHGKNNVQLKNLSDIVKKLEVIYNDKLSNDNRSNGKNCPTQSS